MTEQVRCIDCRQYRGGWCTDAKNAGISTRQRIEIGSTLAALWQWCPAYKPKAKNG
jgi:hypothetical protein